MVESVPIVLPRARTRRHGAGARGLVMRQTVGVWLVAPDEAAAKAVRVALAQPDEGPALQVAALDGDGLDRVLGCGRSTRADDDPLIVLLDLWTPGDPWVEALRELRARPETEHAIIVVLGPSDDDWAVVRSHQLGADAFLTRPDTTASLTKAVREVAAYWLGVQREDEAGAERLLG